MQDEIQLGLHIHGPEQFFLMVIATKELSMFVSAMKKMGKKQSKF